MALRHKRYTIYEKGGILPLQRIPLKNEKGYDDGQTTGQDDDADQK